MNAITLNIAASTARCALCGSQNQRHGQPGVSCTSFTPLPSASSWHETELARRIIADMRMLQAIAEAVNLHYAHDAELRGCCDGIGYVERVERWNRPTVYEAEGIVGDMLARLDTLRTDAIEAERLRVYPESRSSHHDLVEELEGHLDTVAQAVEARS